MIAKLQQLATVTGNSILPILDCFHYDGKGAFTASDLRNTMSISGIDIGIDREFCVNAKDFISILKGLSGKEVEIIAEEGLTFKSGRSKYKLPIHDPTHFPKLHDVETEVQVIDADTLNDTIASTLFAASKDDLRPAMTGIKFEHGYAVATDSHRMVMCESDLSLDFILPSQSAKLLSNFIGDISVQENDTFVKFKSGDTVLISTKINERYPDWEAVVPRQTPYRLTVKTAHLIELSRRLLLVSSDVTSLIVFDLGNDCTLTSQDQDFHTSGTEEMECTYEGEPLRIGFNGRYITEALRTVQDETIEIGLTSSSRAGLVHAEGKRFLWMPIHVS